MKGRRSYCFPYIGDDDIRKIITNMARVGGPPPYVGRSKYEIPNNFTHSYFIYLCKALFS